MGLVNYWTTEEDEILKANWGKADEYGLECLLPGRGWEGIKARAKRLGLKSYRTRCGQNTTNGTRVLMSKEEYEALIASIPEDTRDLTARLCGDPLPGRSALDRMGGV
jgi:hypothetical protein